MRIILFIFGLISLSAGALTLTTATTSIHQIAGIAMLLISAVLISSASIISAIIYAAAAITNAVETTQKKVALEPVKEIQAD